METLLKLYYSCVIPALLYGCKTWMFNSTEIKHLNQIQINTPQKILQLSTFTPIPIIYTEIGKLPVEFRFYERQLLYHWELVNKIKQITYTEYKVMNTKQIQTHSILL